MAYWTTYRRNLQSPESPGEWESVADQEGRDAWSRIPDLWRTALPQIEGLDYRVLRIALPFYPGHYLYEFVNPGLTPALPVYALVGADGVRMLDWSNSTILSLGLTGSFRINEKTVLDYVRFFCAHVTGRYGRFLLLESADIPRQDGFTDKHAGLLNRHVMPLTEILWFVGLGLIFPGGLSREKFPETRKYPFGLLLSDSTDRRGRGGHPVSQCEKVFIVLVDA